MSGTREYYCQQAQECCLNALLAEESDRCTHWLEAAARWVALGRQEGALSNLQRLPNVMVQRSPLPVLKARINHDEEQTDIFHRVDADQ